MIVRRLTSLVAITLYACSSPVNQPNTDAGVDQGRMEDMVAKDAAESGCRSSRAPGPVLRDARGDVTVEVDSDDDCLRTYHLSSTAQLRGDAAASRQVRELADWPTLRSGNGLVDALYALALEETRQNSVDAISDGAFADGMPLDCPDGGCFETGAEWHYVWTRDISYALDLGLAELDPKRGLNSLSFKVSERRGGGNAQVMQDTGTGGSYPVSTDRVVWSLGAAAVLAQLDDPTMETEFAAAALEALLNTVRHDRVVAYDPAIGLYRGEQSFLDWREQSYPSWVAGNPVDIAQSHALGTNLLHLRALEFVATLAEREGRSETAEEVGRWAEELRTAIEAQFWLQDAGQFSTYILGGFDSSASRQFDLLGSSLAVLFGVAGDRAPDVVKSYPHLGVGAPVIHPQQQLTRIYHNRAEWPFVSAYWLRAAAEARDSAVATRMAETLIRGAALNLSNMENWEVVTGQPFVEDAEFSGPVVNSRRQLWSVAAFVSLVHQTIFGLHPQWPEAALVVNPRVSRELRAAYFQDVDTIELRSYRYRGRTLNVAIQLPPDDGGAGFYDVASVTVNGVPADATIPADALQDGSRIEVVLTTTGHQATDVQVLNHDNWREVFAPRAPAVALEHDTAGDELIVRLETDDDPAALTWTVIADGTVVADDLPGTTTSWRTPVPQGAQCFVIRTCFIESGNCSQHSRANCWWGVDSGLITTYSAELFENVGGQLSDEYGVRHWSIWGDPDHRLTVRAVRPARSGTTRIQLRYGNGAGSVDTGITCGVKRITITDEGTDEIVASGLVVMPHLGEWGRWGLSTTLEAELAADGSYRVDVFSDEHAINMSSFAHFAQYSGEGGAAPFNRVNIAELRLLSH